MSVSRAYEILNRLGFGSDVDALESYIAQIQDAYVLGEVKLTDAQYDMLIDLLKELKPESYIFKRNWEVDDYDYGDYDKFLKEYGMKSILTVQTLEDLSKFLTALGDDSVDLLASIKLNGHAIRAVYYNGKLVTGSTRGRHKKGRDITRHLKAVLPDYISYWKDDGIVELRGEAVVPLREFSKVKHILKTPLSAVTSFLRESVSDKELEHLDFVFYKIFMENYIFEKLSDEMDFLDYCGFKTPYRIIEKRVNKGNLYETINNILKNFETNKSDFEYYIDGIVVCVNENKKFNSMGSEGNYNLGNFALKMGSWASNIYKSVIKSISFAPGKMYLVPKAIIEPVITSSGMEVTNVPLYNVGVMEKYKLIPGAEIYFKFGGETGVTLVAPDGSSISR